MVEWTPKISISSALKFVVTHGEGQALTNGGDGHVNGAV